MFLLSSAKALEAAKVRKIFIYRKSFKLGYV